MFEKNGIKGTSKVLAVMLLTGGMFLSQGCEAGWWTNLKRSLLGDCLTYQVADLNESCQKYEETLEMCRNSHSIIDYNIDIAFFKEIFPDCITATKTAAKRDVEKNLILCYKSVASNPQQYIPEVHQFSAKYPLPEKAIEIFKQEMEKCCSSHSKKLCREKLSQITCGITLTEEQFSKLYEDPPCACIPEDWANEQ